MKVKLGDMTINQTIKICKGHCGLCNGCPLYSKLFCCIASLPPYKVKLFDLQEREINLPDEEVEERQKKSIALCRRRNNDTCGMYCSGYETDCEDYVPVADEGR